MIVTNKMQHQIYNHEVVSTIYVHPWGDIQTTLSDLKASDPEKTRPFMYVTQFVCATCQKPLTCDDLGDRIKVGGDLYDARFQFPRKSLLKHFLKRFRNALQRRLFGNVD